MAHERSALPITVAVQLAVSEGAEDGYERNLPFLDEAITLQPDEFEPRLLRAHVLSELGRYDEALADVNVALQPNPDDPRARLVRMRILHALGRDVEAANDADVILASPFAERRSALRNEIAAIYIAAGRDDEAVRELRVYLEASPEQASGWSQLAEAYRRLGRLPEAASAERNAALGDAERHPDPPPKRTTRRGVGIVRGRAVGVARGRAPRPELPSRGRI